MRLNPSPAVGAPFSADFATSIDEAYRENAASHDGAVLLQREDFKSPYKIVGWSYRLASQQITSSGDANRGSAYNSCLAMALEPGVDFIALASSYGVEIFGEHSPRTTAP
jgi:hypothetical protein